MAKRGTKPGHTSGDGPPPEASASERRRETRYIPAQRSAYVGWWEGHTYLTTPARVESLSTQGAALLVDEFPAGKKAAWLFLVGPVSSDWFSADVIDCAPSGGVGCVIRLALKEPLPYDVFKTYGLGLPKDGGQATGPPPRR